MYTIADLYDLDHTLAADYLRQFGKPQIRCPDEKFILLGKHVVVLVHDILVAEKLGSVLFRRHVWTEELGKIKRLLDGFEVAEKMDLLPGGDFHSGIMSSP